LLPAKLRNTSSLALNSAESAVSSFTGAVSIIRRNVLTIYQGVAQSSSTVQSSLATTTALSMGISVRTQMIRTATWVVKETQVRPVADQPYSTCTISPGRTPSGPLSCLPSPSVRGPPRAVTGTVPPRAVNLPYDCANANFSHSDSVASRTLERRVDVANVTVEACIKECFVQSFTIAGLEYAQECCKLSPIFSLYDVDEG